MKKLVKLTSREKKIICDFVYDFLKDTVSCTFGENILFSVSSSSVKFDSFDLNYLSYDDNTVLYSHYLIGSRLNLYIRVVFYPNRYLLEVTHIMVTE